MFIFISLFSLLVFDCQLEILEFFVIYNDIIDRQRDARSHRHWKIYVVPCQTRFSSEASELFVCLVAIVKFFIQFI